MFYQLRDLDIIEPDENGSSFNENALIKSSFVSKKSGLPSLSDDSGICFPDLNNFPEFTQRAGLEKIKISV